MSVETLDDLPLAPRARWAVEAALREARRRGHKFIGTEHLLLGMLAEPDAVATRILTRLEMADRIRAELLRVMEGSNYPTSVPAAPPGGDLVLRHELLRRRARDQASRMRLNALLTGGSDELSPEARTASEELMEVDRDNSEWLAGIVDAKAWPGRSLVGADGASAAWLLTQHADRDRDLQWRCMRLMQQAVERGEASPSELAYLTDRVLLNAGRPQRYGTQFRRSAAGGEPQLAPIEDPKRVDELRASAGLEPLASYIEQFRRLHGGSDP